MKWVENEEKDLRPVVNNKTIPYSYVNYIYREKNWKCPVCEADENHCEYLHCIMCKGLHLKNQVWKMRPSQRCECRKPVGGDNSEKAY